MAVVSSKSIPGLLAACWLVASAGGCTGPGLEPPWSDDDGEHRSSANAGVTPPLGPAPGSGTGEFGNPIGALAGSGAAPMAGSGASPSVPEPTTTPPPVAGAAGSGAVEPPTTTPPGSPGDGGAGGAGGLPASGGDALQATDFVPDCDTELASALTSVDMCRYPLSGDPASVQIATLDAGTPTLLTAGPSMLRCLFGSDYYVDATVTPAVIVLCPQTCSALPSTAQVVAVAGCATAP